MNVYQLKANETGKMFNFFFRVLFVRTNMNELFYTALSVILHFAINLAL